MSRPKIYPEARGSALAGKLERKRAMKALAKISKKKGKMANGTDKNNVTPIDRKRQGAPMKRRGVPIPARDRDVIMRAIGKYSRDRVAELLLSIDPRNQNPGATLYSLMRDPQHRYVKRNRQALADLAEYLESNCQEQIRFPRHAIPGSHLVKAQHGQVATPSDAPPWLGAILDQHRAMLDAMLQVVVAMKTPQTGPAPARLKPRPESARVEIETDPELGIPDSAAVEFKDRPNWIKRKIIHDIHSRVGSRIKELGHEILRPHAEAWNRSYDAFHEATGLDVKTESSERSDRSGSTVRPIEIIEELGELDRFYEIICELWEGWF